MSNRYHKTKIVGSIQCIDRSVLFEGISSQLYETFSQQHKKETKKTAYFAYLVENSVLVFLQPGLELFQT